MHPVRTIHFSSDKQASLLIVPTDVQPLKALDALSLLDYRAAIFMHSGASEMLDENAGRLSDVFEMMARFANDYNVLIADGGTNAGGMRLIGNARRMIKASFPLVGVAVTGKVTYPGAEAIDKTPENTKSDSLVQQPPKPEVHSQNQNSQPKVPPQDPKSADDADDEDEEVYALNADHSHFILVEAEKFGAESDLLVGMAKAREVPKVALVVNGGKIVEDESRRHAEQGTPIVTFKGSFRFADELADNLTSGRIRLIYPMGTVVKMFDVERQSPGELYDLLKTLLIDAEKKVKQKTS